MHAMVNSRPPYLGLCIRREDHINVDEQEHL